MTTALGFVAPMDIHHQNDDHDVQYRLARTRYPTDESIDEFELFICPYDPLHKVNSKRWVYHLAKCKQNYGGEFKKCPFNASHHVPAPELDYHTSNCPDKNIIRQDLEGGRSTWKISTQVNHKPEWQQPQSTEDWDDEVEADVAEFTLNPDKGMPLALRPAQEEQPHYIAEEDAFNTIIEDHHHQEEGVEQQQQQQQNKSVLDEELIPEKPPNWNNMSAAQKKNHKRKYNRQQQRMKEEGVSKEDFVKKVPNATEMTEEQRNAKLAAIKAAYPLNNEKQNAQRADYTSLLNIVCQKIRLNLPEYMPISAAHGGFAFKVRVFQTWYEGLEYSSTKKDAKHVAAKWALLGMDIPGVDSVVQAAFRPKPIHPKLLNQSQQMREADEVGKLMAAGHYQDRKPNTAPLRQPNIQLEQQRQQSQWEQQQQQPLQPKGHKLTQQQPKPQEQPKPKHQQPQIQSQWQGWGAQAQQHSQPPRQQPQQQPRQQPPGAPWKAMNNLNISNGEDFPSLGGPSGKSGATPKPAGVKQNVRGRGRGRATGMKL